MRSTAFVFLLISTLFVNFVRAQTDGLIIQGQTGKLYLSHTVTAGQTWYSIGRLYNIGPKALAAYNSLSMDKPLNLGVQIQIPLTSANFSQTGQKGAGETLLPVYHLVGEKEWMYRISINHNKVPIGSLEKWNHLTKDGVKAGMWLVVGYLQVKTASSAFAKQPPPAPVSAATASNATTTGDSPPPVSGSSTASSTTAGKSSAPSVNIPSDTTPMMKRQTPVVKKGVAPTGQMTMSETTKPTSKELQLKEQASATPTVKTPVVNFNGGYFISDFTDGGKLAIGLAGMFKSTSGWQDGKYYALMNNVPVGTIVKVSLPSTNKSVYAKVLGTLPDMKESQGLVVRISNAAASELGMGDGKVSAEVRY